jgi:hypothetical protein
VPIAGSDAVNIRPIDGWGSSVPVESIWTSIDDGYVLEARVPGLASTPDVLVELDIIINEKPEGRARRRGQLVLSGGDGEFIYLRGDRHEASRLLPFLLTNE